MEQGVKSKSNLIAVLMLIIGLLVGAVGVFLWKDGEVTTAKQSASDKDQKIATLEKQVSEISGVDCIEGTELDDKTILKILTEEQMKGSSVVQYWLPLIHGVHGDYASTSPLPIVYSSELGYEIPAMGGMTIFWHKEDGTWKRIGQCTEGGCEMGEGYNYDQLPKELTH
ncbi:MAG: hypothetical protein ACOX0Z_00495 [Candidatus Nanosyncoccaceae bacterium]|jgi:hypothetical protein